ncbi:MAG: hypothetical protein L6R40_008131 [Gallowayella cf. fulva]|nr:MAG: hypothetical protein L6R40_008131 [Xanthomendoza cf. fulva]
MNIDAGERLRQEKAEKYCGIGKVWLQNLQPEDEGINPRQTDPKNVTRLLNIFEIDGCHRYKPQHHVPVLVTKGLACRLKFSGELEPDFFDLEDGEKLVYLHGHHRLQAARLFLSPSDVWWVADLYSEDLSEENKRLIREDYLGASNFCDGDIFRHLRRCSINNDQAERTWLARLSESKRRDVLQLQKAADKDRHMRKFRDSLDALLPFRGLWRALHLGALHRILPLRCPEELAQYLDRVKTTWEYICDNDQSIRSQLDADTVDKLQGRCLHLSQNDCAEIEAAMTHRELFPSVSSQHLRANILARLRNIKHLIPTIHTFLEDTKYLEPCVQIMKSLLPHSYRGTIHEGFSQLHNGQTVFYEQRNETDSIESHQSAIDVHWKSYRQLWLFAFRHFPEMTGYTPRKDIGRPRPPNPGIEHSWLQKISSLAESSGYGSIRKHFLEREDADVRMIQEFLHQARPPQYYRFDEGVFDSEVLRICSVLRKVHARRAEDERPCLSSERETGCGGISSRCGRPYENSFIADKAFIFLPYIYGQQDHSHPRRFLSTFAVKQAIFHHFFGGPEAYPGTPAQSSVEGDVLCSNDNILERNNFPSTPSSIYSHTYSAAPSLLTPNIGSSKKDPSPEMMMELSDQAMDRVRSPSQTEERQPSRLDSLDSSQLPSERRSRAEGVLIVRPTSPIHWGRFQSDFVNWDQPQMLQSSLGVAAKTSVLLLPDRAQRLKCVAAADLTRAKMSTHNVVIKAPRDKVAEIRMKYEKLSAHTLQAIYMGAIHSIPPNKTPDAQI